MTYPIVHGGTIGNSLKDAFKLRDDFADYLLDALDNLGLLSSEPDDTTALAEKLIVDGWVTRNPSAPIKPPLATGGYTHRGGVLRESDVVLGPGALAARSQVGSA